MRNTLGATERLKRAKDLNALFLLGKAHSFFPLRAVFLLTESPAGEPSPVRICVSAPKKKFKRAHDRNRIKRLLREAWRCRKGPVYAAVPEGKQLHLMVIFSGKSLPDLPQVAAAIEKMIPVLRRFLQTPEESKSGGNGA